MWLNADSYQFNNFFLLCVFICLAFTLYPTFYDIHAVLYMLQQEPNSPLRTIQICKGLNVTPVIQVVIIQITITKK